MHKFKKAMLAVLMGAGMALAANTGVPVSDQQISDKVGHEIRMYSRYSIFDNVEYRVDNGNVELAGSVSQPFKKSDLARIAKSVPGVASVTNDLKVQPLSNFDNQIRRQVARAIYRDPFLSRYRLQPVPPIHIIVDNGHVTLEGVVSTDAEKDVAGIRASSGLSFGPVVNNLRVENPKHAS